MTCVYHLQLESLILKWIPKETSACSSFENQENHIVPTLFQSVEDDAFVWRQLENLEASSALNLSWGSTQAQTLYLSSVNVDARNIVSTSAMITVNSTCSGSSNLWHEPILSATKSAFSLSFSFSVVMGWYDSFTVKNYISTVCCSNRMNYPRPLKA